MFDVIVIGGSYAGMAAALQLARGRRDVAVVDSALRRNRFAVAAHGVPGQDGRAPADIADDVKAQLIRYPNVTWRDATVVSAEATENGFAVGADGGEIRHARRLVLATGVRDELPAIQGLEDLWGTSVFHCPYCHGYELDRGQLGVLATGDASFHQALIIPEWGPTTFFTNGVFEPDSDQLRQLEARNVAIERERVTGVSGPHASVHLGDGRAVDLAGLFVASRIEASNPVIDMLGCELAETPLGRIVNTNEIKETSVAGVFACGDVVRAAGNVTFAMADGILAGTAAHRSLMFDEFS